MFFLSIKHTAEIWTLFMLLAPNQSDIVKSYIGERACYEAMGRLIQMKPEESDFPKFACLHTKNVRLNHED